MRPRAKPTQAKVDAKPARSSKATKKQGARIRDLEKHLAEAVKREAEARDQHTATSAILRMISASPTDARPVFDAIVRSAVRLCDARFANVFRLEGEVVHLVAHHNLPLEALDQFRRTFPQPLSQGGTITAQAMLRRTVIQVHDIELLSDVPVAVRELSRSAGYRSALAVPILRKGTALGAIGVGRSDGTGAPRPFSDTEVDLLTSFADQAVIAIENVRLFTELETKNGELTTALDQQTATSEILRAISSSLTDVQPVFNTIVQSGLRLLGGYSATMMLLRNDDRLDLVAYTSTGAEADSALVDAFPMPLRRIPPGERAIHERRAHAVEDVEIAPDVSDVMRETGRARGWRSNLFVPMIREAAALGLISITRREPGPFAADQIALLEIFAAQAVIAIENVRLFTELQEKNRALTQAHAQVSEALEQQTATAEILRVISSSPTDVQPVFDAIVQSAVRLCEGLFGTVLRFDGDRLHLAAHHNLSPAGLLAYREHYPVVVNLRETTASGAILDRRVVQVIDSIDSTDQAVPLRSVAMARATGFRGVVVVPMLRDGEPIGVINVARQERGPFTDRQVALLQTFADQAVIAIENVRLFTELEAQNRALTEAHGQVTEALDQQTATSEILRVISRSQTDVQPVFDTIVRSAPRLCGAKFCILYRFDGELLHLVAHYNVPGKLLELLQRLYPMRPGRQHASGRAIISGAVVEIKDVLSDPEYQQTVAALSGWRSMLAVPMLRERAPIGAIVIQRGEAGSFPEAQIALIQTFADQAVIAIENVRLFKELQARTQELTRSVEELQALGEVGQAVSSTLDLETVLTTIVSRAVELSGTDGGTVYEYDEAAEEFILRATHNLDEEYVELRRGIRLRKGEGVTGRMVLARGPVQVPDITARGAYDSRLREGLLRSGAKAVLAVPLFREDRLIGGLVVNRNSPGEFLPEVVALLQTFATQSALAIQNARLFREIEDKSQQLEIASQHKSEFLANMSHELRTPLNAVIGFSEVLGERMFGELNDKQAEYVQDINASGTHLLSLINDILDLSKIEAGRMELELANFHLPQAVENALVLVRERALRGGITLEQSIDPRLGEIQGDERKIKQVLLNLLSNAIKFTPEGGRVGIRVAPVDEHAEVAISDTGVGIAPEDQVAVFEEFRQVGMAEKKAEGTGLGLALARKFIELHGGRIWVQSQVGVGSTFTFTLPVRHGN